MEERGLAEVVMKARAKTPDLVWPALPSGGMVKHVVRVLGVGLGVLLETLTLLSLINTIRNLRTPSETDLAKSVLLASPPLTWSQPLTLRVMTYNIYGLPLPELGRSPRMEALGRTMASLAPDVVGVQEAFLASDRRILLRELALGGLAHHQYYPSGHLGSGLLVVSRHPIVEAFFHRFTDGGKPYKLWHGDWWAGKGVALARIHVKGVGLIDFFNTHTHARYESTEYDRTNSSNVEEVAGFIKQAQTHTAPALVVGDFNCSSQEDHFQSATTLAGLGLMMTVQNDLDFILSVDNSHYQYSLLDSHSIDGNLKILGRTIKLSDHVGYLSMVRIKPR